MKTATDDHLLDPEQVAARFGVSVGTLNVWRCTGRYTLPFIKVGRRVRYRESVIEQFLKDRTVEPHAAASA